MQKTLSASDVRERLSDLIKYVVSEQESIILTHDQGDAVLISVTEWESLNETVRLLKDKAALKALIESFENRDAGKSDSKSVEDVFSDLI